MMKTIQRTSSWDGVDPLLADPLCMRQKNVPANPYPEDRSRHKVKATVVVSLSPSSAMDDINSTNTAKKQSNDKSIRGSRKSRRKGRRKNNKDAADLELRQYTKCSQEEKSNREDSDESSPHPDESDKKSSDDEYYDVSRDPWLEAVPRKRLNRGVDCSWVDFALPTNLVDKVKRMTNGEASYVSRRKKLSGMDLDLNLGKFKAEVELRRISKMELRYFVSDDQKFKRLQQELKEYKAMTDGTLKQKLHVFCRYSEGGDSSESSVRDIFSAPASRDLDLKWRDGSLLPQAYRRMNEVTKEKAWKQLPLDPLQTPEELSSMSSKNSWSDRRLLKLVTNYSEKGRKAYHDEFQYEKDGKNSKLIDGVEILKYGTSDLVQIVEEDEAFKNLQLALRRTGAVTNGVLKQGLHFYVRDVRIRKGLLPVSSSIGQAIVPGDSKDVLDGFQVTDDVKVVKKRRKLLKKLRLRRRSRSKEMVPSIEED